MGPTFMNTLEGRLDFHGDSREAGVMPGKDERGKGERRRQPRKQAEKEEAREEGAKRIREMRACGQEDEGDGGSQYGARGERSIGQSKDEG